MSLIRALGCFCTCHSIQIGFWNSKRGRKEYSIFEKQVKPDVVYSQMVRTLPLVAKSTYPKVMDFQDALSMNMERRMVATHRGLRRFICHFEFKMLRSCEYRSFDIFDALTIISEPDSKAIPHKRGKDIEIVPNGVDFSFFKPMEMNKEYDVVFCGNMQYKPNVLTAEYLAREVMPLVWKELPKASLWLVGATPSFSVRCLDCDKVTVTGTVDDIRPYYAKTKVFAAPMKTGSGLQNKLLEAMAMKVPCVTSSIANAALGAKAGQEILVGDTPQEVATHIVQLLQSNQQRDILADNAYSFVCSNYSWDTFGRRLSNILEKTTTLIKQ